MRQMSQSFPGRYRSVLNLKPSFTLYAGEQAAEHPKAAPRTQLPIQGAHGAVVQQVDILIASPAALRAPHPGQVDSTESRNTCPFSCYTQHGRIHDVCGEVESLTRLQNEGQPRGLVCSRYVWAAKHGIGLSRALYRYPGPDTLYEYDLFSVVCHEGSIDNGHYVCFTRHQDEVSSLISSLDIRFTAYYSGTNTMTTSKRILVATTLRKMN
jgi:hypothetical protein